MGIDGACGLRDAMGAGNGEDGDAGLGGNALELCEVYADGGLIMGTWMYVGNASDDMRGQIITS